MNNINSILQLINPDNTITANRALAHAIGMTETIIYSALISKYSYYESKEMLSDDMETGETIWEDYDGFVDHVHACWAETGKGGSWNDFKQQLINVIHYDHDWGWQIVPEHKETVYGKKCTICDEEYW